MENPEAVPMFQTLSNMPSEDDIKFCFPVAERFVVLMYDRSSGCETTDAARLELFTHKSRSIDCIPPTSAALFQHVLCVRYIKQVTAGVRLLFHHLHYPLQLSMGGQKKQLSAHHGNLYG